MTASPLQRVVFRLGLALLVCLIGMGSDAEEEPDSNEVPVVGRPSDLPFSEASGWFEVRAAAEPTTLEAETPLTFTLTVRAVRPAKRPPQRIDLRQWPPFAERFYLEDSNEEPKRPDERTWEFVYRLKPRRTDVTAIPDLPFVYFNPYLRTASKGFQVLYTDPIPLRVLPHETVQVPMQAPESAFTLATGPSVLERRSSWTPPRIVILAALALTPPLGCLIWFLCWRRMYPDAARLASQRRSRAARQALPRLHAARKLAAHERANRVAAIVADYLQQRLDLAIAEPTPLEVAALFEQRHCSSALNAEAVRLFEACDRARFLPVAAAEPSELPDAAVAFILAVEQETCSPSS